MYLAGHSIMGELTCHKSGHALNNKLLRAVRADASAWELVTFDDSRESPISYAEPAAAL